MISLLRGGLIFLEVALFFCVVRLRDFLYVEVASVFVGIGCVMFLGGEVTLFFSLTHSRGCAIFLCGEVV